MWGGGITLSPGIWGLFNEEPDLGRSICFPMPVQYDGDLEGGFRGNRGLRLGGFLGYGDCREK